MECQRCPEGSGGGLSRGAVLKGCPEGVSRRDSFILSVVRPPENLLSKANFLVHFSSFSFLRIFLSVVGYDRFS